jgi:enoyl-CoA hydratase
MMGETTMADSARSIRTEVMEGIALLTFNVPPRNAAGATDLGHVADALAGYADDPEIRVVVLTGAGNHAFVTDPEAEDMADIADHTAACTRAQEALAAFPKPVIARIRGDCIGAGLLLALHADLLIAAEDSAFALPAAQWGAAYPPAAVAALVALVGPQQAKRLLLTGWRMEAREALRIGLVTMVVADGDLSDTVVDIARDIADNAPLSVLSTKRMIANPGDPALESLVASCLASEDHRAGIAARKSGRRPIFKGQ